MIVANPICSVYPEERRVYPACTEFSRSERTRSTRHTLPPQSASVSELCARRLPRPGRGVSAFSSPNFSPFNFKLFSFLDALDAASSLSPLSATLTKSTGGGDIPKRRQGTRIAFPLPSTLRIQLSTVFLLTALASALAKNSPATPLQ